MRVGRSEKDWTGAVRRLRHITESSMKKIFAFDVSDAVLEELWKLAMAYRKEYLGENIILSVT